jgi:hypothetical protein
MECVERVDSRCHYHVLVVSRARQARERKTDSRLSESDVQADTGASKLGPLERSRVVK